MNPDRIPSLATRCGLVIAVATAIAIVHVSAD
jgi:hypothetical protein